MKYFSISYLKYLFAEKSPGCDINFLQVVVCRAKGHPCGVWYYNPLNLEPDMRCKNCGDDLS